MNVFFSQRVIKRFLPCLRTAAYMDLIKLNTKKTINFSEARVEIHKHKLHFSFAMRRFILLKHFAIIRQ